MQDRIKTVRKHFKLTQTEFGEKIGVKGNTITGYETGLRAPSDVVLTAICREFNVDRIWLETGVGEMFAKRSRKEELAIIFGDVLSGNPSAKNRFIEAAALLPDDAYPELIQFVLDFAERLREEDK